MREMIQILGAGVYTLITAIEDWASVDAGAVTEAEDEKGNIFCQVSVSVDMVYRTPEINMT